MKKFLRSLIILVIGIVVAFGCIFLFYGKKEVEQLESSQPLETLVAKTMNSPSFVPYEQISPFFLEATVCVENARFYSHGAVDIFGLIRAGISQIIPGMSKSGGSTITQQVVKNLYGKFNGGLEWKAAEIRLAYKLEQICSKDEILALYVNIINYGDGYIGIKKASQGYFNYTPADLTDAEAALLAGIPQSPSYYQLSDHADRAKQKQAVVLDSMVRNGKITQQEADTIYLQNVDYYANRQWNVLTAMSETAAPSGLLAGLPAVCPWMTA